MSRIGNFKCFSNSSTATWLTNIAHKMLQTLGFQILNLRALGILHTRFPQIPAIEEKCRMMGGLRGFGSYGCYCLCLFVSQRDIHIDRDIYLGLAATQLPRSRAPLRRPPLLPFFLSFFVLLFVSNAYATTGRKARRNLYRGTCWWVPLSQRWMDMGWAGLGQHGFESGPGVGPRSLKLGFGFYLVSPISKWPELGAQNPGPFIEYICMVKCLTPFKFALFWSSDPTRLQASRSETYRQNPPIENLSCSKQISFHFMAYL